MATSVFDYDLLLATRGVYRNFRFVWHTGGARKDFRKAPRPSFLYFGPIPCIFGCFWLDSLCFRWPDGVGAAHMNKSDERSHGSFSFAELHNPGCQKTFTTRWPLGNDFRKILRRFPKFLGGWRV